MSRNKLLVAGAVGFCILIILFGITNAVRSFSSFRQSILSPPYYELSVELSSPETGDQGLAGTPVHLIAAVYGSVPLKQVVFWIDNIPVKVQGIEDADTLSGQFIFPWVPTEPGDHVFFVRAEGQGGQNADSDPVLFSVVAGEKPVQPEPLSPDPAYEGPSTAPGGGSSGMGEEWSPSIGGWLWPADPDSPPAAPGLTAEVDGCQVDLLISDHADDETGFRVYRSLENIPGWSLAATLAANQDYEVVEFSESGYHGTIGYKVAAFNSQGESASNPVAVEVDPVDCPSVELPFLSLQMVKLTPQVPVDKLYCYFSLDGINWQRWPQEGFILPDADGGIHSSQGIFSILEEQAPEGEGFSVKLDCWGWGGGELVDLGQFEVDGFGPESSDPVSIKNEFLDGLLQFGQTTTMEGSVFEGEYGLFLPIPVTSYSDSVYDCLDRLDDSANVPYNYCLYADGETAWPFMPSYVIWELTNNCTMAPICMDILNLDSYDVLELENAEVGYRVRILNPAGIVRRFKSPNQMVYMSPGIHGFPTCRDQFNVYYRVSSYIIPEGSQTMFESASNWIGVPEPCPAVSGAILKVVPEMLFVGNPKEEQNEGHLLDLYGAIFIYSGFINEAAILQFGVDEDQIKPGCPMPDSTDEAGGAAFNGKCPIANGWGVDLNQALVCPEAGLGGCFTNFVQGGNQAELAIFEGEGLTISISVYDYDVNSADDQVCYGQVTLPGYVLDDWLNGFDPENLSFQVDGPNGTCSLQFSVEELYQFTN